MYIVGVLTPECGVLCVYVLVGCGGVGGGGGFGFVRVWVGGGDVFVFGVADEFGVEFAVCVWEDAEWCRMPSDLRQISRLQSRGLVDVGFALFGVF